MNRFFVTILLSSSLLGKPIFSSQIVNPNALAYSPGVNLAREGFFYALVRNQVMTRGDVVMRLDPSVKTVAFEMLRSARKEKVYVEIITMQEDSRIVLNKEELGVRFKLSAVLIED